MLYIRIELISGRILKAFEFSGHAGTISSGENLVCAAASHLSRSTAALLRQELNDAVLVSSRGGGHLSISIKDPDDLSRDWLTGVTDLFLTGVEALEKENPDVLKIEIVR